MTGAILIVGASYEQVPLIEKANERGFTTIAMDIDPEAPGLAIADVAVCSSTRDVQAAITTAREHDITAVTTNSSESSIMTVAEVADALGLPGLPVDVASAATDKWGMKEAFERAGIPTPEAHIVTEAAEAVAAAESFGFPCIVKPCRGAGSRGVFRIPSRDETPALFKRSQDAAEDGVCLIESFVDGIELTADTVVAEGRAKVLGLADKDKYAGPKETNNVAMNIVYPPAFPPQELELAERLIERATLAVGITDGVSHVELIRRAPGDFQVIELGARGGGFYTFSKLMSRITGLDTMDLLLDMALGLDVTDKLDTMGRRKAAALSFVGSEGRSGTISALAGDDRVRQLPEVLEAGFLKSVGDRVRPPERDGDRVAYVIVVGESRERVIDASTRARRLLQVEIDPDSSDQGPSTG